MTECPKYESCSANICVLDDDIRLRTYIKNDRTCHYLRLVAKDQYQGTASDDCAEPAYIAATEVWAAKEQLPPQLLALIEQASKTAKKAFPKRQEAA